MSLTTIRELPNEFDPLVFDEGLKRIPAFLRNADKARERELANGNGEFFFIVAEQWIEQASLLYFFQRRPTEILESAESGLNDFVKSLELGYSVNPLTALLFFSVAVVIDNRPMARFIATAPEAILGFLDDPDSPVPVSVQIVFELLVNQDHKVHHDLEYLHSLLFELPYGFRSYGGESGLTQISGLSTSSTLIAYATQPDNVAEDGVGRNGTYTKHLLRYLQQPGLFLPELFSEVGRSVSQETNGKQQPWVSFSVLPSFCFIGCDTVR